MLRQTSLASLGLIGGTLLTLIGFIAYATGNMALNLTGFFGGIPLLLGGLAFKAAELKPVPYSQLTSPEIIALREKQETPTQKQLRNDVTRYRYGQQAHLDGALKSLGLSPLGAESPVLVGLKEAEVNGAYALILEFDSPLISLEMWQDKREKLERFFGPGIQAKVTQPEENRVDVALITSLESI